MHGIFYAVGVGPGNPKWLTLQAVELLQEARIVVVPQASRGQESIALAVAREHLSPRCQILHLHFPMTREQKRLEQAWDEAMSAIRIHLDKGENVLFLTIGDPMLYSTSIYVFERLRKAGYPAEVVPGVPSFCAAAATAHFPLAAGDEQIAVIPWSAEEPPSVAMLRSFDSVVLLKVASHLPPAVNALREAGLLEQSVMVSNCGRDGEEIFSDLEEIARRQSPPPYLSLILARRRKEK